MKGISFNQELQKINLIIICLLLCIMLVGCGADVEKAQLYTPVTVVSENINPDSDIAVLTFGGSLDSSASNYSEYPLWSTETSAMHTDTSVSAKKEVTFEGKTYSGKYAYSFTSFPRTYQSDQYNFDGGWFVVNSKTGELTDILFYNSNDKTDSLSVTECQKIAFRLADKYINRDEFKLTVDTSETLYAFHFDKYIDGMKTCESLSVSVLPNGKIASFGFTMLGAFSSNKISTSQMQRKETLLSVDTKALVLNKVKTLNPKATKQDITSESLTVLEDGTLAVVYTVKATWTLPFGDGYEDHFSEVFQLLAK